MSMPKTPKYVKGQVVVACDLSGVILDVGITKMTQSLDSFVPLERMTTEQKKNPWYMYKVSFVSPKTGATVTEIWAEDYFKIKEDNDAEDSDDYDLGI